MPTQTYTKPDLPDGTKPFNLVSADLKAQELTPKTRVVCINRGRDVYRDKFDGRDYEAPPGLFEVEYEAADHFRQRSVVPGSRDVVTGGQDVFIAILGLDPPERCKPFSDAECQRFGLLVEAIDRAVIEEEQGGHGVVVATSRARSRTASMTGKRGRDIATEKNASHDAAPEAMEPPVGGDALLAGQGAETDA